MSNQAAGKSFIPLLDGRALDAIKIVAALLMVIDHINLIWFKREVMEMELAGRAVFPLFCYAVAVALARGPDENREKTSGKYMAVLFGIGLFSEPFIQLARPDSPLNVLFTLGLGVFFANAARGMKDWQICLVYFASAIVTALADIELEFGFTGVMLPSAILFVMQGRKIFIPFLLLLLLTVNMSGAAAAFFAQGGNGFSTAILQSLAFGAVAVIMPYALLLMARDLPQDGRYLSKYSLHFFYPGHQLLIWSLGLHFAPF